MIKEIQKAAESLGKAAVWEKTGSPLDLRDDFIYELYIYFSVIEKLNKNFTVIYSPGTGDRMNAFPKSPANKSGRPKFIICDKNQQELAQICAGTKVRDRYDHPRAPDISFQEANTGDTPVASDVFLIHDAKYKTDKTKRLTKSDYATFQLFVKNLDLESRHLTHTNIAATGKLAGAKFNSLITNSEFSTEPAAALTSDRVSEVVQYFPKSTPKTRP